VTDVELPDTIPISTKSEQAEPVQRSIMIPDWLTVPLVHVNLMDVRLRAVALKFVGAWGTRACTAMVAVVVFVKPSPSVTVNEAV
jgi:hypothetical protein